MPPPVAARAVNLPGSGAMRAPSARARRAHGCVPIRTTSAPADRSSRWWVDVDGLVEALYAQPTLTDDSAQAVAEHYTVVFEFDDRRRMSFSGDTQDSTALTDGVNSLQGSAAFYRDEVEARWPTPGVPRSCCARQASATSSGVRTA